jgi:hypothetical protein
VGFVSQGITGSTTDGLQNACLQSNAIEPSRHMSRRCGMYVCLYGGEAGGPGYVVISNLQLL